MNEMHFMRIKIFMQQISMETEKKINLWFSSKKISNLLATC
ncbi:MAG: hypothetical protein V6002_00895 [Candidatus Dasytiphilus stammeri]